MHLTSKRNFFTLSLVRRRDCCSVDLIELLFHLCSPASHLGALVEKTKGNNELLLMYDTMHSGVSSSGHVCSPKRDEAYI